MVDVQEDKPPNHIMEEKKTVVASSVSNVPSVPPEEILERKVHQIILAEDRSPTGAILGQAIIFKKWLQSYDASKGSKEEKKTVKGDGASKLLAHCKSLPTKLYPFGLKQNRLLWACGDPGTYHRFRGVAVDINKWTPEVKEVQSLIEGEFDVYTNFCLLNHYRNGKDSIAPHADGELFAKKKSVFTLSLGGTRKMKLVNSFGSTSKPVPNVEFDVEHGDLFWMWGNIQDKWKHGIDVDLKAIVPRHSLTFRSTRKEPTSALGA